MRVLISATLWIALSLCGAGYAILEVFEAATLRQFDQRLSEELAGLRVAVATDPRNPAARMTSPSFRHVNSGLYFQAETAGLTVTSHSLRDQHLPLGVPGSVPERYVVPGPDGQNLRLLSQTIPNGEGTRWQLGVAADLSRLEPVITSFRRTLSFGLSAFGFTLIMAVALMLNATLGPLKRLHHAVLGCAKADTRPAPHAFPAELAPLVRDLDQLIDRARRQRDRGQLQAAGLAHALKTPTTILAGEFHRLAQGRPLDVAAAEDAIARLAEAAAFHLDHAATGPEAVLAHERIDVMAVLATLTQAIARLHPDISIKTDGPESIALDVSVSDLQEMLGNLIENAACWAQARVCVRVRATYQGVTVVVEDDGIGVPAADRTRIFERGVQLCPDKGGSGLGLTIARDVAALYGGALGVDSAPLGGLRATLKLPDAG
ncbi:MAG: HAMP domain-containing sensor histidine kinase [Pseudomonadota bacterium]